ncbi:MAG TPA: 50S ribosomal protein L21e [Thermofilum sp.]|nr:50S ribosomal protein L21e [Thermofilum sp.]
MKHSRGFRTRGRRLLSKPPREKGRGSIGYLLYEYSIGEKVVIDIRPGPKISTAPHRRYQGKVATVVAKRGRAYVLKLKIGNKEKTIITTKEHIKPFVQASLS